MMRTISKILLAIAAIIYTVPAIAQTPTVVTGTVTDTGGIPYSNASISAQLIPSTASPTIIVNGIPKGIGGQQNATTDLNGNFSMNLFCNTAGSGCSVISPSGTQWLFTVTIQGAVPPLGTGPQQCSATLTITGASQSITSSFSSCPALSNINGGGPPATPGGPLTAVQINSPLGHFGGSSIFTFDPTGQVLSFNANHTNAQIVLSAIGTSALAQLQSGNTGQVELLLDSIAGATLSNQDATTNAGVQLIDNDTDNSGSILLVKKNTGVVQHSIFINSTCVAIDGNCFGAGVAAGTLGQPAIYTATSAIGSSAQSIDISAMAGANWGAKLAACNTYLVGTAAGGGTCVVPDPEAIDGAETSVSLGNFTNLKFTGSASFTACTINAGKFSDVDLGKATLVLSGSNCTGVKENIFATLQLAYTFRLTGGTINCNSQVGATGIYVNTARARVQDTQVTGCLDTTSSAGSPTAGLVCQACQFTQFDNLSFYDNYVDIKDYNTAGGGGGSNIFTNIKSVGVGNSTTPVGVIVSGLQGGSTYALAPDQFVNFSPLSHYYSGFASFGNTGCSSCQNIIEMIGGAPEVNGAAGSGTVTIDGNVIDVASLDLHYTIMSFAHVYVAEATVTPVIDLQNQSFVAIYDPIGYGNCSGQFTKADSTSNTEVIGYESHCGTMQNVVSATYAGLDSGSANAYVLNDGRSPKQIYTGKILSFIPSASSTSTTPTLNYDGLGAKTITKLGTAALVSGDLISTAMAVVIYDGTGWQLQNPQSSTGANTSLSNLSAVSLNTALLSNVSCSQTAPCYSFVGHTGTGISLFTNDLALDAPTGAQVRVAINGTPSLFIGASNMNFGADNSFAIGTLASRISTMTIGTSLVWTNGSATADTELSRSSAGVLAAGTSSANTQGSFGGASFQSLGTKFTASGCSLSGTVGGATAGQFTSGTSGTCTVTVTMGSSVTAPNGWSCWASDQTTPANIFDQKTGGSTTTAVLSGTTVTSDVISFGCLAY